MQHRLKPASCPFFKLASLRQRGRGPLSGLGSSEGSLPALMAAFCAAVMPSRSTLQVWGQSLPSEYLAAQLGWKGPEARGSLPSTVLALGLAPKARRTWAVAAARGSQDNLHARRAGGARSRAQEGSRVLV